ncbi:hypothetical protein [Leifsonia sp. SIMBA_070]|uniref:hypothetical protein n=1 Tax=Leifsonia sp. SIMBA_070 TaxID=3085810 RepID=UPI003977FABF
MTELMTSTFSDGLRNVLIQQVESAPQWRRRLKWRWGVGAVLALGLLGGGTALAAQLDLLPGAPAHFDLASPVTVTHTGTATIQLGPKPEGATQVSLSLTAFDAGSIELGRGGSSVTISPADLTATTTSGSNRTTACLEMSQLDQGGTSFTITTSTPTLRWTATLTWVSVSTTAWAKNASGQSYGVQNEKGTPDLIAVTATNGKDGYVYRKDLEDIDGTTASRSFTSPQQALDWQETHHGGDIPVFKSDGTTKVGTFHVGQ